jgi:HemY protein
VAAERAAGGLSHATARAVAALEDGERADPKHAGTLVRQWLDAAAEAQPDPAWICATCGHPGEAGPASGHWQAVCPHCAAIDGFRWQRPVLPTHDILLAPAPVVAFESEAADMPAAIVPETVASRALPPADPARESTREPAKESVPASPADSLAGAAEKRLETQLAPSVDAARLIN